MLPVVEGLPKRGYSNEIRIAPLLEPIERAIVDSLLPAIIFL